MDRKYTAELEKIEEFLNKLLPAVSSFPWGNQVFPAMELKPDTAENLLAPGRDLFSRGGKRWRPLLAHLVCQALGGGEEVLPLLPLVEFTHNASLIHDDLEDNSEERRGKPAIHVLYGSDTAINSGSFLYFLPLVVLENWEADSENKNRLWKLWAEHVRFLHLGQSMDIAWHREKSYIPSLEDYMLMCRLKTGSLARFAALLGVEAARFSHKKAGRGNVDPNAGNYDMLIRTLGEAAQNLGVGFQILDDVKNLSTGVPGKKRGDDVVEGKKSLPVLLFLLSQDTQKPLSGEVDRETREDFVQRCFKAAGDGGTNVPEIEEFIVKLTESGALDEAEKKGKALIAEAGTVFSVFKTVESKAGSLLSGLTEMLLYGGS